MIELNQAIFSVIPVNSFLFPHNTRITCSQFSSKLLLLRFIRKGNSVIFVDQFRQLAFSRLTGAFLNPISFIVGIGLAQPLVNEAGKRRITVLVYRLHQLLIILLLAAQLMLVQFIQHKPAVVIQIQQ